MYQATHLVKSTFTTNEQAALDNIDVDRIGRTIDEIRNAIDYPTYDVSLILVDGEEMQQTNLDTHGVDGHAIDYYAPTRGDAATRYPHPRPAIYWRVASIRAGARIALFVRAPRPQAQLSNGRLAEFAGSDPGMGGYRATRYPARYPPANN